MWPTVLLKSTNVSVLYLTQSKYVPRKFLFPTKFSVLKVMKILLLILPYFVSYYYIRTFRILRRRYYYLTQTATLPSCELLLTLHDNGTQQWVQSQDSHCPNSRRHPWLVFVILIGLLIKFTYIWVLKRSFYSEWSYYVEYLNISLEIFDNFDFFICQLKDFKLIWIESMDKGIRSKRPID